MRAAEVLPERFNAAAHFVDRNVAEGRGARPAFLCADRTLSYADFLALVNRTGNALRGLGVGPGDRVVMICLDAPEFLGTFWGAMKIGAVPVPVNTLMRAADYRHVLNDSQAGVAVVSAPLLAEAAQGVARTVHEREEVRIAERAVRAQKRRPRAPALGDVAVDEMRRGVEPFGQ